jgi:dinuclear metal center YbgI/SA1388 family protein
MRNTVADALAAAERRWPVGTAESWDAPGLLVGDPTAALTRIHLAVDATVAVAEEAVAAGAELLIVHHPLLLRGVTSVAETGAKGAVIARLIRGGCALLAAHTNADIVESGTSAMLAGRLGLVETAPISPSAVPGHGLGRTGRLPEPLTLRALAERLQDVLPATAGGIRAAGDADRVVEHVALCGGAGDSLLGEPAVQAADVYITSDLRHHPASDARELALVGSGPALIDVSHWASESLWLDAAAEELRADLPDVAVTVSRLRTDPWDFALLP